MKELSVLSFVAIATLTVSDFDFDRDRRMRSRVADRRSEDCSSETLIRKRSERNYGIGTADLWMHLGETGIPLGDSFDPGTEN